MSVVCCLLCCVCSVEQETLGRGINVVVVDSRTKSVYKVEHFDTYEFSKDSLLCVCVCFFLNNLLISCDHLSMVSLCIYMYTDADDVFQNCSGHRNVNNFLHALSQFFDVMYCHF